MHLVVVQVQLLVVVLLLWELGSDEEACRYKFGLK